MVDLVVVGAGASGQMVAATALERHPHLRVTVVDRARHDGGLAYGRPDPGLLLNVRAGNLHLPDHAPDGFVRWAQRRAPATTTKDFLPRRWFGDHVAAALCAADPGRRRLRRELAEVGALRFTERGSQLHLDDGRTLSADVVVLALGNTRPAPLPWSGRSDHDGFERAALDPEVLDRIGPADPVVVVGSGLTAVDVLVALGARGHHGPVTFLSRRGELPLVHDTCACAPDSDGPVARAAATPGVRLDELVAVLRAELARAGEAGRCWQPVFDALRPHTERVWAGFDDDDRQRFLAEHRHDFDRLRHRLAPAIDAQLRAEVASGRLRVRRGAVGRCQRTPAGVVVHTVDHDRLPAARWVLNATGPDSRTAALGPVVTRLVSSGRARAGWGGMGVDVDHVGRVLDVHGRGDDGLWALGPMCRGTRWETTAVPELRQQVTALLDALAPGLDGDVPAASAPHRRALLTAR